MKKVLLKSALFLSLMGAGPLAAQRIHDVEVGAFMHWTKFDKTLYIDDFFAYGMTVQVPLRPALAVAADLSVASTNGPPGTAVRLTALRLRALTNRAVSERITAQAGLGLVHNSYGASRKGSEFGVTMLLGARVPVAERVSLRIDATADYIPSAAQRAMGSNHNLNLGFRQGLSIVLGKTPTQSR